MIVITYIQLSLSLSYVFNHVVGAAHQYSTGCRISCSSSPRYSTGCSTSASSPPFEGDQSNPLVSESVTMGTLYHTGSLEYHSNLIFSASPPPLKRNSPLFTIPDDLEGSEHSPRDTGASPMVSTNSSPIPARVLEVKEKLYTVDINDTSLPLLAYTKAGSGQYYRVVNNSCVELLLTQGRTTIIDLGDLGRVLDYKWFARKNSRSETLWHVLGNTRHVGGKRSSLLLHRYILDLNDPKKEVDHINGNGLDNRRINLRLVDRFGQTNNFKLFNTNTTGVNGVHHREKKSLYVVQWRVDGKRKCKSFSYSSRGLYDSAQQAFEAAKEFRKLKDLETGSENGVRDKDGVYSRMTEFSGEEGEHQAMVTEEYLNRDGTIAPPPTPVPRASRIGSCVVHVDQEGCGCLCEEDFEIEQWENEGTLSTLPLPDPTGFPRAVGDEVTELLSD